jgi:hypothetical protein
MRFALGRGTDGRGRMCMVSLPDTFASHFEMST